MYTLLSISFCSIGCFLSLISGSGRCPGEGNCNPFQYSWLENHHGQRSLLGYSLWGRKDWTWMSTSTLPPHWRRPQASTPSARHHPFANPTRSDSLFASSQEEARIFQQAGIKIARRNINNLRYADDTTLMAESEEELKSLLMIVKEESEKVGLKLNIP